MNKIINYNQEIKEQLNDTNVKRALLETTFKGLSEVSMRQALLEGMMRGFQFKDFLEKNIYAVPFGSKYSLITSIDYARKLGLRGGVTGISEPTYEEKDGKIIACSVTVNKGQGNYSAKVYFDEYSTGKNLWVSKPRTMIAKVAEMHALRKACPEELSQAYTEEEMVKESATVAPKQEITDELREKVNNAKTEAELKAIWDANKGLGKEFSQLVVAQKKFLKEVAQDEKA